MYFFLKKKKKMMMRNLLVSWEVLILHRIFFSSTQPPVPVVTNKITREGPSYPHFHAYIITRVGNGLQFGLNAS